MSTNQQLVGDARHVLHGKKTEQTVTETAKKKHKQHSEREHNIAMANNTQTYSAFGAEALVESPGEEREHRNVSAVEEGQQAVEASQTLMKQKKTKTTSVKTTRIITIITKATYPGEYGLVDGLRQVANGVRGVEERVEERVIAVGHACCGTRKSQQWMANVANKRTPATTHKPSSTLHHARARTLHSLEPRPELGLVELGREVAVDGQQVDQHAGLLGQLNPLVVRRANDAVWRGPRDLTEQNKQEAQYIST